MDIANFAGTWELSINYNERCGITHMYYKLTVDEKGYIKPVVDYTESYDGEQSFCITGGSIKLDSEEVLHATLTGYNSKYGYFAITASIKYTPESMYKSMYDYSGTGVTTFLALDVKEECLFDAKKLKNLQQ